MVELLRPVDHLHRPPAKHVARTQQHRIADPLGDRDRLVAAAGKAVGRLLQAQLVDQLGEALAVLGQVDAVRRGAEDRDAVGLQLGGELQRRLPAELDDHALKLALLRLAVEDFQHILAGQRLEIEPVAECPGSVETVSGLQLTMIVSNPASFSAKAAWQQQ